LPEFAISVEGLSKRYLVGHQTARAEPYTALRDVIARSAINLGRKTIDMLRGREIVEGDEVEEFWALRDIFFDIRHGDRVGIIGRNGAGKSTLLKILSRVTEPTKGRIKVSGKVASLLEVGTGFHPELSGRENIFLNGAILGMSRTDIRGKFDEIVAFAEVERFLDTPVKRYSSGMYVRLAFAVAAHLEPEILVVDEVLAVGDAAFQKKCLGKMEQAGSEGRTVLFVSHNMAMISSLCDKAIQLENGQLVAQGSSESVILNYATSGRSSPASVDYRTSRRRIGDEFAELIAAEIRDERGQPILEIEIDKPFSIRMEYRISNQSDRQFVPNFHFYRADGSCAFIVHSETTKHRSDLEYAAECHIPPNFMNDGLYSVRLALSSFESGVSIHFDEVGALTFNVRDPIDGVPTRVVGYTGSIPGSVRPLLTWTVEPID
jgi:lipopolysaccharide transport system ATP-binding protein